MATFDSLPNEIVLEIISHTSSFRSLTALACQCRRLQTLVNTRTRRKYHKIRIRSVPQLKAAHTRLIEILKNPEFGKYIRTIELAKPDWVPDSDDGFDDFENPYRSDEDSDLSFVGEKDNEVKLITAAIHNAGIEGLTVQSVYTTLRMCLLKNGGNRRVICPWRVTASLTFVGIVQNAPRSTKKPISGIRSGSRRLDTPFSQPCDIEDSRLWVTSPARVKAGKCKACQNSAFPSKTAVCEPTRIAQTRMESPRVCRLRSPPVSKTFPSSPIDRKRASGSYIQQATI